MKYMLIAGEASGDLHASELIKAIKKLDPEAEFKFLGGDKMAAAAGVSPEIHYDSMNVMGFSEVIRAFPRLLHNLKKTKEIIRAYLPDVLIPVDFPGFNLKVAKYARRQGVRVDYFISPKVWAWKEYRVKQIKKNVRHMYSILPFEVPFFLRHGYGVNYVGNPSVSEIDNALGHMPPLRHFLEKNDIDGSKPLIAILPGSRRGEIRNNLPIMMEAVKRFEGYTPVVAGAPSVDEDFYREVTGDSSLKVVFGATPVLLKYSRAALVTSGTATLESALVGIPQVVCYRANGSRLSYWLMDRLVKVKYVSLPNLIAGNRIVPELLLHNCTPARVARELGFILQNSPERDWQLSGYRTVRNKLGNSSAPDYAAELIVDSLRKL